MTELPGTRWRETQKGGGRPLPERSRSAVAQRVEKESVVWTHTDTDTDTDTDTFGLRSFMRESSRETIGPRRTGASVGPKR